METNTLLILRRFSILVTLLFFSVMLNAQIKIKSRVEIAPKAATSNSIEGDSVYLTSFTLEYPAEVRPSSTLFETSYIDTITGKLVNGPCCPVSCNGHYVVGVNAECG